MILAHSCSPSVAQSRAFQSPGPEQGAAPHARADLPRTTQLFELPASDKGGRRREHGQSGEVDRLLRTGYKSWLVEKAEKERGDGKGERRWVTQRGFLR